MADQTSHSFATAATAAAGVLLFYAVALFLPGALNDGDTYWHIRDIAWTILTPTSPAIAVLDHRAGWHRLYTGRYAVIHARDDSRQANAR